MPDKLKTFPEIDNAGWYSVEAKEKINEKQIPLLGQLTEVIQ